MGWFGQLIGTDKVLNNVVDKDNGLLAQAGNWIGGFSYTAEEKAEADAETREWRLLLSVHLVSRKYGCKRR